MSGGGDPITFDSGAYGGGQAADGPPPLHGPDAPVPVQSSFDGLYNALVAAANGSDPTNGAEATGLHGDRAAEYADTLGKFPATDTQSAQMLTTAPEMVSSMVGALTGALTGALGGLVAVPEALAQAGTQAMQAGMGAMSAAAGSGGAALTGDYSDGYSDGYGDDYGDGAGGYEDADGGGGAGNAGGALDGTQPAPALGEPAAPPPPPTFPAAAPPSAPPPREPQTAGQPGMGGMAPMPMGGAGGGSGAGGDKPVSSKRLQPPVVKNGRPVHGRFIADRLDAAPVVNRIRRPTLQKDQEIDKEQGGRR